MRKYEILTILDSKLSADGVKEEVKNIQNLIQSNGGFNVQSNNWGKKEIAFKVKKQQFGNFILFNFDSGNSDTVEKVGNILRISENVLRYQTTRINDRPRKFKGRPIKPGAEQDLYEDSMEIDY